VKLFLFLALVPLTSLAQITSGIDSVLLNEDLCFSTKAISTNANIPAGTNLANLKYHYGVYSCTTKIAAVDFSAFAAVPGVCTWYCVFPAIGSPRPFYISKNSFGSLSFATSLNLADTSIFSRKDTLTSFEGASGCYLPYLQNWNSDPAFVLKTSSNNYALFKLQAFFGVWLELNGCDTCFIKHPYVAGYVITWYLQNNGTTDFSKIGLESIVNRNTHPQGSSLAVKSHSEIFNVMGQLVSAGSLLDAKRQSRSRLLIERNPEGIARLILH
jgi:hypothetical protein